MEELRYAILRHEGIADPHYDLLFEQSPEAVLTAFRAEAWPIDRPTALKQIQDHRAIYLNYEGPISGNRGHVAAVERGTYVRQDCGDGRVQITLTTPAGARRFIMTCTSSGTVLTPSR